MDNKVEKLVRQWLKASVDDTVMLLPDKLGDLSVVFYKDADLPEGGFYGPPIFVLVDNSGNCRYPTGTETATLMGWSTDTVTKSRSGV